MSIVKNEPKYKKGPLQAIRAQLEHRPVALAKGDDVCAPRYHK